MMKLLCAVLAPLVFAGCIGSSGPPPPNHTTVVVPPGSTAICNGLPGAC